MPRINIYEHSETYSFQTKNNAYATVAFPIAAIWGPTFVEGDEDSNPDWVHFSSGFRGTTDFMQTFRGANNYLGAREKSFDYALKLLAAGYDILVKRVDGLGNKSSNGLFVIPAGVAAPIPASTYLYLKPAIQPYSAHYDKFLYRVLMPHAVNHNIVWDYSYVGEASQELTTHVYGQKYNAETNRWEKYQSNAPILKVTAKSANTDTENPLVVVVGKPNIITTQQKPTRESQMVKDDGNYLTANTGKQVTVQGSVPISVYTADGILLERRNVTMTETTEAVATANTHGPDREVTVSVDSVLVPEFTYIQIDEIPALLSLKVAYEEAISNLYSSNEADVKLGMITVRLGNAWTQPAAMSCSAAADGSGVTGATVDELVFNSAVQGVSGTYVFTYDGTKWTLGSGASSKVVTPAQYGVKYTGTPANNDTITVTFAFGTPADVAGLSAGTAAVIDASTQEVRLQAKYPGTFGNNLKVRIKCGLNGNGFKIGTVEVFDNNGYSGHPNEIVPTDQLLELVSVAFDEDAASDNRPLITEATFSNLDTPRFIVTGTGADVSPSEYPTGMQVVSLLYGTDYATDLGTDVTGQSIPITADAILELVAERFPTDSQFYSYMSTIAHDYEVNDQDALIRLYNQQIMYSRFYKCVSELTDPICYDWDALVQGIADDQYVPKSFLEANRDTFFMEYEVSTLVTRMIEVAANSKCGAALIGTPFGMPRGIQTGTGASAVKTGALKYKDSISQVVGPVYSTFGEVVGPWCKTTLALAGANSWIAPEVAHLLLIINSKGIGGQNKWWMVPAGMLGTGIVHTPEYKIKRHYLDLIQDHDEGVCLNPLMEVPGKGFTCFGNSTLWDKPLGSYNALQNLSTRFLTNRVKQRIWDTALQILFRYNNEDAYSHFYAGLSPLLDEMRAVGALTGNEYNPWGYRIIMNPDIVNLDRINANTVIGKVELAVTGVIDTVDVDLFLLPPTGFQETYD
jgi:hypothetical protein